MARIRTIKPEFWDSPGTARASLRARLFFIAMWNWADDWGIGDAHPLRLLSFAFPNDESSEVEPRNFRSLAEEVAECYDVEWYEVDGRAFYAIPSWEDHQRTEKKAKRKNPPPDQADSFLFGDSDTEHRNFRDSPSDGSRKGEVGKGKGEPPKAPPRGARGDRIPEPFIVTGEMRAWAAEEAPGIDVDRETRAFVDYWRGVPGARGRKLDWPATWRNRIRDVVRRQASNRPLTRTEQNLVAVAQIEAREQAEQKGLTA